MPGKRGIHIPDKKALTAGRPIAPAPQPARLYLPLAQNRGAPSPEPIVNVGDQVIRGQVIAQPAGNGVALHAPAAGTIAALADIPLDSGQSTPGIVIDCSDNDRAQPAKGRRDWEQCAAELLIGMIRDAGIVGLGGATFPAHIKLQPVAGTSIDTVIVNGCECEPYVTADYRTMIERADAVIEGARISMHITGATRTIIAVEKHMAAAIERMRDAAGGLDYITIRSLPSRYPQGAEKVVIQSCTGRHLETGQLPRNVGVIVHNVNTLAAMRDAVVRGTPLTERVVTVSGEGLKDPANLRVRIGTPVGDIIEQCGGRTSEAVSIVSGGPMMGVVLDELQTPVTKGTTAVLVLPSALLRNADTTPTPCIRCGRCVHACPRGHLPYMISELLDQERYEEAVEHELMDCLECGCCAFACPARRNVISQVKKGKAAVERTTKGTPPA